MESQNYELIINFAQIHKKVFVKMLGKELNLNTCRALGNVYLVNNVIHMS